MAPSALQQRRTHNTLLFQKLLNLRDGASPFTLLLDTLEQSSAPVRQEFVRRAKIGKSKIIYISFSTLRSKMCSKQDVFISAHAQSLSWLRSQILSHLPAPAPPTAATQTQKYLLIFDELNNPASKHHSHLSTFLSSLLVTPQISLLAAYHTDIPPPQSQNPYAPDPLTTLTYSATAILTARNLAHVIARKRARDRSVQEPVFGLEEGREGVLVGLKDRSFDAKADLVVEMEIRRKSGRGVVESFVLSRPASSGTDTKSNLGTIQLLDDYPLYSALPQLGHGMRDGKAVEEEDVETTFNLGLTEKQKRDRDGVVLPYFDAQKEGGSAGPGDGGRILYEMGDEDREDFDDEEDEI